MNQPPSDPSIDEQSFDDRPDDAELNSQLDEAFALYLSACDTGELDSREDFLKQFPSLSGQLRELMEAADMIGNFTQIRPAISDPLDSPGPLDRSSPPETIGISEMGAGESAGDFSAMDPHATLPMANRPTGDLGPSLPFEMEDYTLLKVLGVGGMGVVYLAKQRDLERLVAVKMIRSGMLAGTEEVKRFYTEAKAAACLRHPNIVAVHQFGRRAGHHFFSMQYIEGEDLQRVLKKDALPPRRAAEIVRDVARAIDHAHQRGVLHRDLKPGNVLIDPHGQVHVTDFGLAKHVDADSSLTGTGEAVGTPHYMAPEQAIGKSEQATHATDIYSLGAVLFAAVTGNPPLVGDTIMQTLMKVAHHPAPTLRSVCPEVDADLSAIVEKCLQKEPARRYASASALADDLQRYLTGEPIAARSMGPIGRIVQWTKQIPVVAAIAGRHSTDAPISQRRLQTAMIAMLFLMPVGLLSGAWLQHRAASAMPKQVRLAGGLVGGLYTETSRLLGSKMHEISGVEFEVTPTGGTWDNRDRLIRGEVHLAPMQASAVGGEQLSVVAPLFYEAVHVLIRKDGPVRSIGQLRGHSIAVGPEGSGSRRAAELVLDSLQLGPAECPRVVMKWPQLKNASRESSIDEIPSVAIICIGPGSDLVHDLLVDQQWQLMSLSGSVTIALQHPTLRPMTLSAEAYPEAMLPAEGIETVGTTAFLVSHQNAPDRLVELALTALYREPGIVGLIPAERAAEWQGLAFHRAARAYFDAVAIIR
ncbi:serine/threonine-protein kinase [Neorhodopirellula pilleata]|uniref:non-specific serine/threonine protein kinase n=1 Tax=Neorhodopirellula pilleata TaxID=2714738 RepID=A0A5C6APR4_9BACT|nr:serine/threonine-protein kinase [Neorhodopirellula pilleata]TWU01517.1 Serine/threonine-protein kinase PrkC [Neorhodopirellula pilleata]